MRYAIIRGGEGLPARDVQLQSLARTPYDVAFEERAVTPNGQRWLLRHLQRLQRGDEVVLWGLDVLRLTTAELVTLLLRFFQSGVVVRLTQGATTETLDPADGLRALSLLAQHEARRPSRAPAARRTRRSGRPLSPYQIKYAHQMLRSGASRRAVGLLFQLSPDELSEHLAVRVDGDLLQEQSETIPVYIRRKTFIHRS